MENTFPYYRVKSVEKALKILEALSARKEASLSELSNILNLTKTNVHRLLLTLIENGFVLINENNFKYTLSLKLFVLGGSVNQRSILINIAFPYMEKLAKLSGETINLGILYNNEVLYIEKIDSPENLRIDSPIGKTDPAYCTSLGKCLLSGLEKKELEMYIRNNSSFKSLTKFTIINPRKLMKELEEVRNNGYAIDREELTLGIRCIGSPIHDANGKVIAAVSISGPSVRMTEIKIRKLKEFVLKNVQEISLQFQKMG